jgi:hypothetical protein
VLGMLFSIFPVCAGYAIYSCAQQRKRDAMNPQPMVVNQVCFLLQQPRVAGC